jgi:IS5 family transposase
VVNWRSYNESLVRRGEVMLDFDVIDGWHDELEKMNEGKEGASFRYPHSFVQLLGYMRAYFHLPYRQTEGVVRAHAGSKVPSIPDYSTLCRRINSLDIRVDEEKVGNNIVIALDSTGIKVANRGEWMRHKWHVRRGYLKIHVAVDVRKKKVVSLQVTSEDVHDSRVLKKLVDHASENNGDVSRVLADGAYDSKENFWYLSDRGIEAAIRVKKNSSGKSMGCYPRKLAVLQQLSDFDRWKHSVSYGHRWIAESVFSAMKRMFGEYVMARSYQNMAKEMFLKMSLYNMFVGMRL